MTARTPLLAVFAAMLLASALALMPRNALACSAGPDWNPARESDLIIAGRVTGMELAPSIPSRGPVPSTVAVTLIFAVDRYVKGNGPSELRAIDTSSVTFMNRETPEQMARFEGAQYMGAGGACGALHADPRGRYVVFGLSRAEDGTLRTHLLLTFGVGDGPSDPAIVSGLARAQAALTASGTTTPVTPRPAATGHGVEAASTSHREFQGTLLVATLALVVVARFGASRVAQSGRPR